MLTASVPPMAPGDCRRYSSTYSTPA